MNYKDNRFRASYFALFLSLGLISCNPSNYLGAALSNPSVISISELKPQNVETTVYLKGKVIDQAPFLGGGAYQLQDTTGTVWVLTNQTPPKLGAEVTIQGKVTYQSIPISNRDIGEVYIVEVEQLQQQTTTEIPSISPNPTPIVVKPTPSLISPTPTPIVVKPTPSPTPIVVKPTPSPTPIVVKPAPSSTPIVVKPAPSPETSAQIKPTPKPAAKINTDDLFLPHKQINKK